MTKLMKTIAVVGAVLAAAPSNANAHDFNELQIDRFGRLGNGPFLEIILSNTVKGRSIVCAVFNGAGDVLATDTWITDNLATKVFINYEGRDVATTRCVFND